MPAVASEPTVAIDIFCLMWYNRIIVFRQAFWAVKNNYQGEVVDMANTKDLDVIEAMSRKEFFNKIICDIGARKDFSRAATFGVEALNVVQKDMLADSLSNCGIPRELTDTDEKFNKVIKQITSRSVALRWYSTKKPPHPGRHFRGLIISLRWRDISWWRYWEYFRHKWNLDDHESCHCAHKAELGQIRYQVWCWGRIARLFHRHFQHRS